MSKVISFSISDKYLEKLRTLYPALTDNLAAKQFLTDGLESSLGNSLDGNLDGDLDGKLKSLIESSLSSTLDDVLDERLDAVMGKLLTSLSERLSMLEARLDDSLDGSLDEMELLLRMQREASITSLIPTGEPSPIPTIEETSPLPIIEETVETDTEKVESVYTVETDSIVEPVTGSIGPVPGDSSHLNNQLSEAVDIENRQGLTNAQLSEKTRVPVSTVEKWKGKIKIGEPIDSKKYPDFFKQWRLNPTDSLWYEVD